MFTYNTTDFTSDSLYYFENNILNAYSGNPIEINSLREDDGKLLLSMYGFIEVLDSDLNSENLIFEVEGQFPDPQSAIYREGEIWAGDSRNGMVRGFDSYNNKSIFSNSPYADGNI